MNYFFKITLFTTTLCSLPLMQAMQPSARVLRAMQEDKEERCELINEELVVLQRSMETNGEISSTVTGSDYLPPRLQKEFAAIKAALTQKHNCAQAFLRDFYVKLLVTAPQTPLDASLKSKISIERPEGSRMELVMCIAINDLLTTPHDQWITILDRAFAAWLVEFRKSCDSVLLFDFTEFAAAE